MSFDKEILTFKDPNAYVEITNVNINVDIKDLFKMFLPIGRFENPLLTYNSCEVQFVSDVSARNFVKKYD